MEEGKKKCKFEVSLACGKFENPDTTCWYESFADCFSFSNKLYRCRKDVDKSVSCDIDFFNGHKHTHSVIKKIIGFIFTNGRDE